MEIVVTVQMGGADVPVGTLFTHARQGAESASFCALTGGPCFW